MNYLYAGSLTAMGKDKVETRGGKRILHARSSERRSESYGLLSQAQTRSERPRLRHLHDDHLANLERLKRLKGDAVDRILKTHRAHVAKSTAEISAHALARPLARTSNTASQLKPRKPLSGVLKKRPAEFWLRHHAVPFDRMGRTALVLVADPAVVPILQKELESDFDTLLPVTAEPSVIEKQLLSHYDPQLTQAASRSVPLEQSCRSFSIGRARHIALIALMTCVGFLFAAPTSLLTALASLALLSILLFSGLRLAGLYGLLSNERGPREKKLPPTRLPVISMIVPLYREAEIGRHLLRRLCRVSYPRDRLEVLLVMESDDEVTQKAIECADLPDWFRVIRVPQYEGLKTKPRAMNYALNFCRGSIVGVWDAEDAPCPHQLTRVAYQFQNAPRDVVCLQGMLDFYNTSHNWISRCFTLEYAGWFRIVLRGLADLRLVVPLGGTTMFIKRDALKALGAWDAYNVTEDADLGLRLARMGWRTEMLDVTTYEEANSQVLPWIKQRSRWLKGFMMTYIVHMRRPRELLQDIGLWRFLGLQAFFVGTLGHFLLAPILWSFWLVALGIGHPVAEALPQGFLLSAVLALLAFEALNTIIWIFGARASGRALLALWTPMMPIYFMMGCAAAYKALFEIFAAPFFWDKTTHGQHGGI